jgi:glucose-1-phosphate adenylyltransferase
MDNGRRVGMHTTEDILAVILGGGRGSRLYPLTKLRSKPAVPIAGKYRLIYIPLSNCINSNIYRIAILTQFNSVSLHRHISNTYNFDNFHPGWVQIWAAELTNQNVDWYQGTADAVRKQLLEIQSARTSHVLILAGDHLYRMDYSEMAKFHWDTGADITVAVHSVSRDDAPRLGILKRDSNLIIRDFAEKPSDPDILKKMVSRDDQNKPFLGSMGIYLFNTDALIDILQNSSFDDFGGHVIPASIRTHKVVGFDFEGYWVDIGTIRSFYETNLRLTLPDAEFNLFDQEYPIYTHARYLPGTRIQDSHLENVLLAEGGCIEKATVIHSIVGLRSQIGAGCRIMDTILMGSDYYSDPINNQTIPIGIGKGCEIEGAIIDKNARLGDRVIIKRFPIGVDLDRADWVVRDGIVVIPKNAVIPDDTIIKPDQ